MGGRTTADQVTRSSAKVLCFVGHRDDRLLLCVVRIHHLRSGERERSRALLCLWGPRDPAGGLEKAKSLLSEISKQWTHVLMVFSKNSVPSVALIASSASDFDANSINAYPWESAYA